MKMLTWIVAALTIVLYAPSRAPAAQGQTQTLVVTVTQQRRPVRAEPEFGGLHRRGGWCSSTAVVSFSRDSDLPVSLGILIDKSTSMRLPVAVQGREKIPAALLAADGAARVVVRLMKPQDEYLIMLFDEKSSVKQSFTSDKKKVTESAQQEQHRRRIDVSLPCCRRRVEGNKEEGKVPSACAWL